MLTTVPVSDILALVNASHRNPHFVLGFHMVDIPGPEGRVTVPAVRAFLPEAKRVHIIEGTDGSRWEMERVHESGLFELIAWDRKERFPYRLSVESYYGHTWEQEDPYAEWVERITEFDRYLFSQSMHYKMYEKMGAHITERNGVQGTHFSVWAPDAQRVSVIGDFNNWDGRRDQMEFLSDCGVWVLFKPEINVGEVYKFEIKTRDGRLLEKADPYAFFAELRPKTASVVYTLKDFEWHDDEWMASRATGEFLDRPLSIYEVHAGSWRCKGEHNDQFLSYREMADQLIPYVKEMGFTHIEFMPLEEHPFDGSWGYQVTGYFAPTSRFGTPQDLQYLVDRCHQEGIGVLLDWVPAHFPKDAHGLAEFDGSAMYEHADPRQGEHPDWGTKIFNFGRNEVKNFLISNALYWIDKFHFDGLRVDAVASMLYLDYSKKDGEWLPNVYGGRENLDAIEFMKHLNSVAHHYFPGVLMMAEESTSWPNVSRPAYMGGLGFGFKWNMGWMHDVLSYMQKDPIHRRFHHSQLTFGLVYAWSENFILPFSHDEVTHGKGSMINKMPGDYWQKFANLRVLYLFMWTHPGKQLLFMGQEFAQFKEWNPGHGLDWSLLEYDSHKGVQRCVADLNKFYKKEPALWEQDFLPEGFEWINCEDGDNSVISYVRRGKSTHELLVVVINFTPVERKKYRIGVPLYVTHNLVFNSDAAEYGGSGKTHKSSYKAVKKSYNGFSYSIELDLPALGALVLKPENKGKK